MRCYSTLGIMVCSRSHVGVLLQNIHFPTLSSENLHNMSLRFSPLLWPVLGSLLLFSFHRQKNRWEKHYSNSSISPLVEWVFPLLTVSEFVVHMLNCQHQLICPVIGLFSTHWEGCFKLYCLCVTSFLILSACVNIAANLFPLRSGFGVLWPLHGPALVMLLLLLLLLRDIGK